MSRNCVPRVLSVFALFLLTAHGSQLTAVFADTVYCKSGEVLTGLVVEEHRDRVVVNSEAGERTLLRREVEEVFYSEPERNHLYLGRQAVEDGDYALARGFFQKARQINPRFSEAEDALRRLEDVEGKSARGFKRTDNALQELRRSWGMELERSGTGTVRIVTIQEGSPAAAAGLRPGDGLVSCWGESMRFLAPAEAAGGLLGPAGTDVKLTIERPVSLAGSSKERGWPGWRLRMERLGLTVQRLDSGGTAHRGELLPGDRITAINGRPTRYLPFEEAHRRFQEGREKGVHMVIHRDLIIRRP